MENSIIHYFQVMKQIFIVSWDQENPHHFQKKKKKKKNPIDLHANDKISINLKPVSREYPDGEIMRGVQTKRLFSKFKFLARRELPIFTRHYNSKFEARS